MSGIDGNSTVRASRSVRASKTGRGGRGPATQVLQVVPKRTASAGEEDRADEVRAAARLLAKDEMNRRIIALLQEDGRMGYSEIARKVGTSEGTVRNRVGRMIESKLLRIIAVVEPVALGNNVHTMVGLKLSAGADPRRVARSFVDCDEVTYVLFAAGRYDFLVEVICEDQEVFRTFLIDHCYRNPDIAVTEPLVGLQLCKSLLKWGVP